MPFTSFAQVRNDTETEGVKYLIMEGDAPDSVLVFGCSELARVLEDDSSVKPDLKAWFIGEWWYETIEIAYMWAEKDFGVMRDDWKIIKA